MDGLHYFRVADSKLNTFFKKRVRVLMLCCSRALYVSDSVAHSTKLYCLGISDHFYLSACNILLISDMRIC